MDRSFSRTPRRLLMIGGMVALIAAIAGSGVAVATSPVGTATSTVIADGTFSNSVNINTDPIKLRTKDRVEVVQLSNTGTSGWSSGWHAHSGPVFVNITGGALTFYSSNCHKTVLGVGQGYIESPYDPILARNEGSVQATWITTQVIPVGASRRIDVPTGLCGVL
jgi:hypothetical protein